MMKQNRRIVRDPHFYWKMLNMVLACVILVLAAMILLGGKSGWYVNAALLLGICMSAFEGIMQLAKERKILGYGCSIFAGVMAVALIIHIILIWGEGWKHVK